jgi:ATP-binding cassette subfamily B protein
LPGGEGGRGEGGEAARARATATLRRILALSRDEWPLLAGATALLLVASAATLAYPQGMRVVMDSALRGRSDALGRVALAMLGVAAVQGLAAGGRAALFAVAGQRIALRLRERLYRHLLAQEIAFFDARRTGELLSRLTSDAAMIHGVATTSVSISLRHVAMAAGGIVLLLAAGAASALWLRRLP